MIPQEYSETKLSKFVISYGSKNQSISLLPLACDSQQVSLKPFRDYSASLNLKLDHVSRPLWVFPDGLIIVETFHVSSSAACEFLSTVAEPLSRPELIHEYQMTIFSLYAAVSLGISVNSIIETLNKFSKNEVPDVLVKAIINHCKSFGKLKIVLRDGRYFVEASNREELSYLLSDERIKLSRVYSGTSFQLNSGEKSLEGTSNDEFNVSEAPLLNPKDLAFKITEECQVSNNGSTSANIYSFEISGDKVDLVTMISFVDLHRPLLSEYDFRSDNRNPSLDITLKHTTQIRYYQEYALRMMFSNGRARSGIIVLPCGAGKTLTGITAACTMRKSILILTTSAVAVTQWRQQFEDYTNVDSRRLHCLTSGTKDSLGSASEAEILITTYTMMAFTGKRSTSSAHIINQIQEREWGLLIFDEVQFAPAPAFRRINSIVKAHCKLGLTATLVREDDLIQDLQWLIGPKLYEANWMELQDRGYLARALCSEVWCPMTSEFFKEYLNCSHAKRRKLWVCNPNKLKVCEFLIRWHEQRGDKILVFSDSLFALISVAVALKRPFVCGSVDILERIKILQQFKQNPNFNTIFLSKVGDNAIDIPLANVVIQISFNFASRRQEAQRLGRILRPKPYSNWQKKSLSASIENTEDSVNETSYNAFFYSLLSKDTEEMQYADKRQQFIIDQGYSYRVLPMNSFPLDNENLHFSELSAQIDLLNKIKASDDLLSDDEEDNVLTSGRTTQIDNMSTRYPKVITTKSSLAKLSGGDLEISIKAQNDQIISGALNARPTKSNRPVITLKQRSNKAKINDMHSMFRNFHKNKQT
ncbi:DNA repair helicase RAD25 family protein [Cryptosporidium andersoni]|uniref:DNA 3'-5' helicase n=1 Tax=Cryptosporidium andersoni TaxID=117008 RepID=A0A1J4MRW6_9CRYT|nr:DNA repair helicase RAD25 family protein [Cryptosporidium andersoni]